jgi:cyclic beta-1,2-glucan synthetase
LFSAERLEQHARSLAKAQRVSHAVRHRRTLPSQMRENSAILVTAFRAIAKSAQFHRPITPAGEWFLDNFHIVEAQIREAKHDLPTNYYRELPKLAAGPLAGYPRVYGIAWALVAHSDSGFDEVRLTRFVKAYQQVQPLTIGELWAIAITLRIVLVENLARLARDIVLRGLMADKADAIADRILGVKGHEGEPAHGVSAELASVLLSPAFVARLEQRLRDQSDNAAALLRWLDEGSVAAGTSTEQIIRDEYQNQGATNVTVRNVITSMKLLSAIDWTEFVEEVSLVDAVLRQGSDFAAMDFPTRDRYRRAVENLARHSPLDEIAVARAVIRQSKSAPNDTDAARRRDPGYYLISNGAAAFKRQIGHRAPLWHRIGGVVAKTGLGGYISAILLAAAAILLLILYLMVPSLRDWRLPALLVLGFVPAFELAIALINYAVVTRTGPACLPGLELRDGVPQTLRTLLVMPTLLSDSETVERQIQQLEVHYLGNSHGDIRFALLSDWLDSDNPVTSQDEALLKVAIDGVARLNERHGHFPDGPRFYLLHRRRLWNAGEGKWMGWERKRGKLHELNRLLRGATDTSFLPEGPPLPSGVRYIITLDADTRLPRGAARKLIGKMAHPLNRPRIDPLTCRVVEGHGILQPRVTPSLPVGSTGSLFQWAFSGPNGLDPYAFAVSDIYQDLFDEGSYVGKGIYDIDAFEASLHRRIPQNTVLSHDLLEGSFARAALASDIEVVEEFPTRYDVELARQHRWVRGDWQLLPWVFWRGRDLLGGRHRCRIPALARWKMFDNLRRSLFAPALLLALLWGWSLPFHDALVWSLFIFTAIALPPLLPLLGGALHRRSGVSPISHMRSLGRDFVLSLMQIIFVTTFLARHAWMSLDAICRTLARLFITRRSMLEWVSFAQSAYGRRGHWRGLVLQMAGAFTFAVFCVFLVAIDNHQTWFLAAPFILTWAFSPAIARWASETPRREAHLDITADSRRNLRLIARRTWRFFETFVTPQDNMLPPDNFQEDPRPLVANRTSPTNIGLYLLSVLAARDFGWIGMAEMVEKLEATLATMEKMERFRGHFLNWYDTRTLDALDPRYVSSVDSGNLAGNLIALRGACRELLQAPILQWHWFEGARDALALLRQTSAEIALDPTGIAALKTLEAGLAEATPDSLADIAHKLAELERHGQILADAVSAAGGESQECQFWARALCNCLQSRRRDLDTFFSWLAVEGSWDPAFMDFLQTPSLTLGKLSAFCAERSEGLPQAFTQAAIKLDDLAVRLDTIAHSAQRFAQEMEFGFLFDPARQLLAIGYNIEAQAQDSNVYDLLASEARLASFFAIAKGDVPTRHWFRLGRTMMPFGHSAALLSWSGSMFEYLMPALIMREPLGSVLAQSNHLAVQRQIHYGASLGVPWGISESQYNARDHDLNYQYTGFGVPDMGLKRGLSENTVIAPYATGLAAMVDPVAALRNYRRLAAAGARGTYGWYEALDYTRARLPEGVPVVVVRSYMAHHQAMTIVAIANVIHDGAMRERFHAEPMVQATDLLLQERMPRDVAVARPPPELHTGAVVFYHSAPPMERRFDTPHTRVPGTHLMSNGRYSLMLTAAGSGYSRWHDLAITRWREDKTRDNWGSYIYLRDTRGGQVWSVGYQPCAVEPDEYEAVFSEDRAQITRTDGALTTVLEVALSSEDDAELRRVSITNHGTRQREIEVTSYAELALARPDDDVAHLAFSKLFVETEYVREIGALLATRRRRSDADPQIWVAHLAIVEGQAAGDIQYETDRARFLGRGHTNRSPDSIAEGWPLSNTVGAVLDPVFAIRRRLQIPRGQTVTVTFWTLAAQTREEILDLVDRHHDSMAFSRATTLAATQAQGQLQHLGIGADEAHLFQSLASNIIYSDTSLRAPAEILLHGGRPASVLWPFSISGDLPIVVLRIDDVRDIDIVRQMLRARDYWRLKQFAVDLVILNERAASYAQDLQGVLDALVRAGSQRGDGGANASSGNAYVLRADLLSSDVRSALLSAARVVLSSRSGSLADQIEHALDGATTIARRARRAAPAPALTRSPVPRRPSLEYFNGHGGFAEDGREYLILLDGEETTPAPWVNIIANPEFGFAVSAEGAGFTWAHNSQQNQLTAWSNDPVSDAPCEVIYIRDEDTGEIWCPCAGPIRTAQASYSARHGQGYSVFEHAIRGITLELTQFVPLDDPVKISRLKLVNTTSRSRRLTVTAYVEWTLGAPRVHAATDIVTEIDPMTSALFARNPHHDVFSGHVAFLDLLGVQRSWTADRTEFLGRNGGLGRPAALAGNAPLSGQVGGGLASCGVLQTEIHLEPGTLGEVVVALGQTEDTRSAQALVEKYRAADLDLALAAVKNFWDETLGTIQVKTPDRATDILLNRWLLYQTLSCRVWGRTGFYQASGAFGFRDQLQDVMALCVARPELARAQILRAAGRQFIEGDVQHWWLPESGKGIRTRIADDRVWLGYVVVHYLEVTGDFAVLDEVVPFLEGEMLEAGESDAFFAPTTSARKASLYEHCALGLDQSLSVGRHGLPLMGTGDWNDGMNRVGEKGRGESVWLGWFLCDTLSRFVKIAERRGDSGRVAAWFLHNAALKDALEENGWDGDWYRRAYFDDGTPLGSVSNRECRIDSIAQSWSVLSGAAHPERAARAMEAVDKYLVRADSGIILLFAPPFVNTIRDPGYIKGYPAGLRENGGQYTHGVLWSIAAFSLLGNGDKAGELLSMINPINHTRKRTAAARFSNEPNVTSGDVYSVPPHDGRAGWSWYSGSAAWMYRVGIEYILGLKVMGDQLVVDPCIPSRWPGFEAVLRHHGSVYEIKIDNPENRNRGVARIEIDGKVLADQTFIPLTRNSGTHHVKVLLGDRADIMDVAQ